MGGHISRRDGERGMEAGDDVGDVPHVGRAGILPGDRIDRVDAEPPQVLFEERGQDAVVAQIAVRVFVEGQLDAAPGRQRGGLEDVFDFLDELLHVRFVPSAHQEFPAGPFRHDVGRGSALFEEAMQAGALLDVLAEHADAVVGEHERVERVDALLRVTGGVGGAADELELHVGHGQCPVEHLSLGIRVEHHGGIDFLEDPGPNQPDLPATAFFGGRPDHLDPSGKTIERLRQGDPGAGRRGGDQVVAAAMSQATERVVLREKGNRRSSAVATGGDKGGGGVGHADFDLEALLAQQRRQPADRLLLLVGDLGVGMDVPADSFQLRAQRVDPGADPVLELSDRRLCHGHPGQ